MKSITDTDKDGYTVKELAEQYAIDLKITAPEVKNLLQHMKSEFDRLLQER
ncbi:MAG: hypothetical protein H6767_05330 [Candidatus Peribacteria bacterium]|nr:MAG: hypothetical protein H6767_05330 [Candidatus Peribacteria bacterium]